MTSVKIAVGRSASLRAGRPGRTRCKNSRCGKPGGVLSSTTKRAPSRGYCAASETSATDSIVSVRSSLCPTISRLLPLCRWKTASVGPLMELGAPSQTPRLRRGFDRGRRRSAARSGRFSGTSAGALPSNTSGPGYRRALVGAFANFCQITVALVVGQPDGLERAVAFDRAGRVVVNAFAGTRKQARRGIVLIHDQIGVGLVALKRDADDHLADRGAGQRVGAAQRLRAEQHVNAKRAALPHDAIQQDGRALRNVVFLDEKFLELVNHQQRRGASARCRRRVCNRRGPARRACGTNRRAGAVPRPRARSTLRPNSRSLSMATTRACGNRRLA